MFPNDNHVLVPFSGFSGNYHHFWTSLDVNRLSPKRDNFFGPGPVVTPGVPRHIGTIRAAREPSDPSDLTRGSAPFCVRLLVHTKLVVAELPWYPTLMELPT